MPIHYLLDRLGLVWFGFEPVLYEFRSTPTQFAEYSYRQYLKGRLKVHIIYL